MLIHDPAAFSLVMPTCNGTPFVRRTLDYLAAIAYQGPVVLSDNSTAEHRAYLERCAADYPGLSIRLFTYPEPTRFLTKLAATLEALPSRCVMLHAHDDFFVPEETEACVRLLETRPEYAAARGRVAYVSLDRSAVTPQSPAPRLIIDSQLMRSYEQDDAVERVMEHVQQFTPTFYSVHRRNNLIEGCTRTEAHTQNVIFFQYLLSAIVALQGKIHTSEWLYYVRQFHHRSWSARLREGGNYEHWPLLITSPHFSRYYGEFRAALCELAAQRYGADAGAFGSRLDAASVSLMRRAFVADKASAPPDEERFSRRLSDPASPDNAHVRRLADLIIRYPDTY